jgi:ubiquinone/menaquinone biosynthesis C-methylase UbiE
MTRSEKTRKIYTIIVNNKKIYENLGVVKSYSKMRYLQKPEEIILNRLKSKLKNMNMLDIGVGGGRTTLHFAKLTKEYIGIDFSKNMIKVCKKRFHKFSKRITFITCDSRSMPFRDEYFDLILFSFNGIDYMSHEDRSEALKEIRRVGKEGGYLCFSTHNLYAIDKLFTFKLSRNPFQLCDNARRYVLLRLLNKDIQEMKKQSFVTIKDGGDQNFKLITYYIKPRYQIEQLINLGFKNVEVLSLEGKKIKNEVQLKTVEDPWVYYSCQI